MENYTLGLSAEEINRRLGLIDVDKTPVTKELVWENAVTDVGGEFPAQTIELDLKDYVQLEIHCLMNTTSGAALPVSMVIPKGLKSNIGTVYGGINGIIGFYRDFTFDDNGIMVGTGYKALGSSEAKNLTVMAPHKVYGIKGV